MLQKVSYRVVSTWLNVCRVKQLNGVFAFALLEIVWFGRRERYLEKSAGWLPVLIKEKLLAECYKSQRSMGLLKELSVLKNFTNTWNILILLTNEQGWKFKKKDLKIMKLLNVNADGLTSRSNKVCNLYKWVSPFKDAKYHSQKSYI